MLFISLKSFSNFLKVSFDPYWSQFDLKLSFLTHSRLNQNSKLFLDLNIAQLAVNAHVD